MKNLLKVVKNKKMSFLIVAPILTGCSVFGIRSEETPNYQVLIKNENKEIREYSPYIIATTRVEGSFKDAQNQGFRILAAYIFGDNEKKSKISMTAPVIIDSEKNSSEKISMTAPVVQTPTQSGWEMSFMMPSKYSLESLPKPLDNRIVLKEVDKKTVAVISFTGFWSEEKNQKMASDLKDWLAKDTQYEVISVAMFAGYDPPWTIPFLRRNEMMIEVRKR